MTVLLPKDHLLVTTAPKVACTSIKYLLFRIQNGFEFKRYRANGTTKHIHNTAYPAKPFDDFDHDRFADYRRLTVVREPVARLLSCYGNRVVHYNEAAEWHLTPAAREAGVTPDPTLDEFIEKLDLYREHLPSIRLHSNPMTIFLGDDPSYYHAIYTTSTLNEFNDDVNEVTGTDYRIERRQTDGPKFTRDDLSAEQIRTIEEFYADDYRAYARYF